MPHTLSRLGSFLPYLLSITSNGVSRRIADEYETRFGINIPEWRVMAVLGDAGALTQRDLVEATMMDKVAVNRACKTLEARGLVSRSPNLLDGRSHHLELTESGRQVQGDVMTIALDMEDRLFRVLDSDERRQFKAMLGKLRSRVDELVIE